MVSEPLTAITNFWDFTHWQEDESLKAVGQLHMVSEPLTAITNFWDFTYKQEDESLEAVDNHTC